LFQGVIEFHLETALMAAIAFFRIWQAYPDMTDFDLAPRTFPRHKAVAELAAIIGPDSADVNWWSNTRRVKSRTDGYRLQAPTGPAVQSLKARAH